MPQPLDAFAIDIHEVTNCEFQTFIDGSDYRTFAELSGSPLTWKSAYLPGMHAHPVVNVTWHDALAYCQWVSTALGRRLRLPMPDEWEKAALGADGRLYPWGDEFEIHQCHSAELSTPNIPTVPVAAHDSAASPFGVSDLVGNVMEWTGEAISGSAVVMGGSWRMNCEFLGLPGLRRTAPTELWRDDLGFRCAWSR